MLARLVKQPDGKRGVRHERGTITKCVCGKKPKFTPAMRSSDYFTPATVKCLCSREVTGLALRIRLADGTDDELGAEEISNTSAIRAWNKLIQENNK